MFKFTNSQDIYSVVNKYISEEDFKDGITLLEKLINISSKKEGFNIAYGEMLNRINIWDPSSDIKGLCHLEEFLAKLFEVSGNQKEGMLDYYTGIGFYDMLENPEVAKARLQDQENKKGGAFHLNDAEAKCYKDCPNYFYHYIVAYQLRNSSHHVSDIDFMDDRLQKITSMFVVYLDQCLKNKEAIEKAFEEDVLKTNIDYDKFVEQAYKELADFEKTFLQLVWVDEKENAPDYDQECCFKFIGEAGAGKTTQMKKKYWEEVKAVAEKKRESLPIWINLGELNGIEEATLEQKIRTALDQYSEFYEVLLKYNKISLYLDGYNEVLLGRTDKQDSIKKTLASDIDEIHKKYPKVPIFLTDRKHITNPPCLKYRVKVCHYNGMSMEDIYQYCNKKMDQEDLQKMNDYLKSENASWLEREVKIPGKIDKLISLVLEGIQPTSEIEFYTEYLEFILDREWNEKKETRLDDLRYLLHKLAKNLNGSSDEKSEYEILDLWSNHPEASRLLALAKELPILIPGSSDRDYKFAYPQYYYIFSR